MGREQGLEGGRGQGGVLCETGRSAGQRRDESVRTQVHVASYGQDRDPAVVDTKQTEC